MGTGGLDKIVERDDEGGGEQAESGTDCEDGEFNGLTIGTTSVAEEVDKICKMKRQLQGMIDAYEAKI